MSEEDYAAIIDESIKLELQLADLYFLFHTLHPQDADFWWVLTLEEKNHATLIKSISETSKKFDVLPHSLFASFFE